MKKVNKNPLKEMHCIFSGADLKGKNRCEQERECDVLMLGP